MQMVKKVPSGLSKNNGVGDNFQGFTPFNDCNFYNSISHSANFTSVPAPAASDDAAVIPCNLWFFNICIDW
jgi:hypothetical protein